MKASIQLNILTKRYQLNLNDISLEKLTSTEVISQLTNVQKKIQSLNRQLTVLNKKLEVKG